MTRREIALYKLASFSEKMQKRAGGQENSLKDAITSVEAPHEIAGNANPDQLTFGNTMKLNAPMLALLGLTGASVGGMFGGEEGSGKRRLLAALGLPSVYAAYLAAKNGANGGLLDEYGINGWKPLDEAAKYVNYPFWYGVPKGLERAWNTPANNAPKQPIT